MSLRFEIGLQAAIRAVHAKTFFSIRFLIVRCTTVSGNLVRIPMDDGIILISELSAYMPTYTESVHGLEQCHSGRIYSMAYLCVLLLIFVWFYPKEIWDCFTITALQRISPPCQCCDLL
jgi:hypothetical protein